MKSGVKKHRRRTRQEVDALLGRYHKSGMTVAAFCKAEGVGESVVYRRLRRERMGRTPTAELVEMNPPMELGRRLRVTTPGGYRLDVPFGFPAEELKRLVDALEA